MRYAVISVILLVSVVYADTFFISEGNLEDPSFEEELANGQFPDWTFSGSGSFIREEYREYDGDSYAIIEAETAGDNYFYQDFSSTDLDAGDTYFVSFRYKILDDDLTLSDGEGARVKLAVNGGPNDGTVYAATLPDNEETGDNWQPVKVAFTARSDNSRLMVGMWGASGTLAIDDVRINVMEEQEDAVLDNPDLEPFGDVGPAPHGWTVNLGGGTASTVDDDIRSGSGALELSRLTPGATTCTQTISINQRTRYWGYVYIYTDDVGSGGAKFTIKQSLTTLFESDPYAGDNAWDRIEFDFTTEADGEQLTFILALKDAGTARFDALMFRRMPLMAADFEDSNWATYWPDEGGGIVTREAENGNHYLKINNGATPTTTTVWQDFPAIEGLPYIISGKIKADATPSEEGDGAYIRLYDKDLDEVVAQVGPYTDEDEWVDWAFDFRVDPIASPSAARYKLKFDFIDAYGWIGLDHVNVECAPISDYITVTPQPRTVDRGDLWFADIGGDDTWTIYTYWDTANESDAGWRNAHDLEEDLTETGTNYDHYFQIPDAKVDFLHLSNFGVDDEQDRPAIVIGDTNNAKIKILAQRRGLNLGNIRGKGEGYILDAYKDNKGPVVLIISDGAAGRYYGVQTFLQLLLRKPNITPAIYNVPEVTIYDWPDMPIRAAHIGYPTQYLNPPPETGFEDPNDKNKYSIDLLRPRNLVNPVLNGDDSRSALEVYARLLSRMKVNMLVIGSPLYYCLDMYSGTDGKTNLEFIEPLFEHCRKYYVEPVPQLQSFGHAKNVLQFYPNYVETCWVGGAGVNPGGDPPEIPLPQYYEEFTGGPGTKYVLKGQYVLDTPLKPVKLYVDILGELFELNRGEHYILHHNPIDFDLVNGFVTEEVEGGIEDKQNAAIEIIDPFVQPPAKFYVEYDFANAQRVGKSSSASTCPNMFNALRRNFLADKIDDVVEHLQPRYIHFGHDEPNQMHTCRLCNGVTAEYVEEYEDWATANAVLFAEDVNFLNDKYQYSCYQHIPGYGGSYRAMIFADHVSYPHEKSIPYDWDETGAPIYGLPMLNTPYGGGGGAVHTCKYLIDKSVIMNDWHYWVNEDPDYTEWHKWKFVEDLTNYGFDVLGGSAGYPYRHFDYYPHDPSDVFRGGTPDLSMIGEHWVKNWKTGDTELADGTESFFSLIEYEGTYDSYLPLCTKCKVDDNGVYWFDRNKRVWGYRQGEIQYPMETVEEIDFRCNVKGRRSSGTVWLDDVNVCEADHKKDNGTWHWEPNTFPDPGYPLLIENGDFEDLGTGGRTFANWDDPIAGPNVVEVFADSEIKRVVTADGVPDNYSCKIVRHFDPSADPSDPTNPFNQIDISLKQNYDGFAEPVKRVEQPDPLWINGFMITGYVRTREVDTLRLINPWQWMKCGRDFKDLPSGKYLGAVNFSWSGGGECLPHDDDIHARWKYQAGTVGVAEWNWTYEFPNSRYLKHLWWDPFIMFEKEVTW